MANCNGEHKERSHQTSQGTQCQAEWNCDRNQFRK
jgi:hypothetical protein